MPQWTKERWQWRSTPHSSKLQHYYSLTTRLFSVISRTLVLGILPFFRDAVRVFYSPRTLVGESYHSAGMQLVYSTVPADWATGHLLRGVLPLCRDADGVFCTPQPTGPILLLGKELDKYFLLFSLLFTVSIEKFSLSIGTVYRRKTVELIDKNIVLTISNTQRRECYVSK